MRKELIALTAAAMLCVSSCASSLREENLPPEETDAAIAGETLIGESMEDDTKNEWDLTVFDNVYVSGIDLSSLSEEQMSVLYEQARYCQAMTEADTASMREMVSEDMVYVHMSGKKQSREEYFADIEDGSLCYHTIGIEDPVIRVDGDRADITYTSVLNADAYGAAGIFRIKGTHYYEKRDGKWIAVNR